MKMTYFFSTASANVQPYVYVAQQKGTPFDIVIYLQDLFLQPQTTDVTSGPFTLTKTSGNDPRYFPYKIVVGKASPVWTFDNTPIRAFRDAYWDFLIALEARGLKPGSIDILRQTLAQYLPLTFTETLYYRYGFDPVNGYIDLQPGMRLRVDYQVHQLITPPAQNYLNQQLATPTGQDYLNGFVGGNVAYYTVSSYGAADGSLQMGFSPFLSMLQSTAVDPSRGGAGGIIDLNSPANTHAYYRLFYPKNFISSESLGFSGSEKNITLVAANSLKDLRDATRAYVASGNCNGLPVTTTFFRGRALAIPEITVLVNGTPTYLAVGTTVRQLMSAFGPIPRLSSLVLDQRTTFQYFRWVSYVYNQNPSHPTTMRYPQSALVNFPVSGGDDGTTGFPIYSNVLDSFDLPVLGGDSVTLTIPDQNRD